MDLGDLRTVVENLVKYFHLYYPPHLFREQRILGLNDGLHLTGGEPFLRYEYLREAVRITAEVGVPGLFVETNCFWCTDEDLTEERFRELRELGLAGVLISVNPFVLEHVPFENIERGVRCAVKVFGPENVLIYHPYYYSQVRDLGVQGDSGSRSTYSYCLL